VKGKRSGGLGLFLIENACYIIHILPFAGHGDGDTMTKRFPLFFLIAFLPSLLFAETGASLDSFLSKTFPDNGDLRKQYWTSLITAPKEQVYAFGEKTLSSKSAGQVKIKSTKRNSDFLIQFINASKAEATKGSFIDYSRGSVVIQRDASTGYFLQAKIFLQDDPGCYLRLYPQAEATRLDVVMYGALIKKGLYASGLIYYILSRPFSEIIAGTRSSFNWALVFGPDLDPASESFAREFRASLPAAQTTAPSLALSDPVPVRTIVQASMPSFGLISSATPSIPSQPPAQPAQNLTRSAQLVDLVTDSSSFDALALSLAAKGEVWDEVNVVGFASPSALGLSNDQDPLVPATSYKAFPKYEEGKGMSLAGIKALLYLDSLNSSPSRVYALVGDSIKALVVTYFDDEGLFHFAAFQNGKELGWEDLASAAGAGQKLRVLRMKAGA
jgi:hypothetical protein